MAIDYFLQHKVRPKILFVEEIDKKKKNEILDSLKLNINKFRYVIFPVSFDFKLFEKNKILINSETLIIVQYDGKNKPLIF